MTRTRRMLVTSALPYANGATHLGHLVEQIQTDIWVRTHKSQGIPCYFICGDDAHGTPIMISAEKQGITPEALIEQVRQARLNDFNDFYIGFDYYGTTHCSENQTLASTIYTRLKARGDMSAKTIEQAYDPEKEMFLPDRYVKGTCPRCKQPDQYGDNCEACGATYTPEELINPVSVLSGATPVLKETEHFFFELSHYQDWLTTWLNQGHLQSEIKHKLLEWFQAGLKAWDITRDAPYFGFEIPDAPGKYFYVWLDAPVGYMASFQQFVQTQPDLTFDDFWTANADTELYHFVGKDIIYFHALFWPAMLTGADFRVPTNVFAHGFLTVDGKKMSKSRGTFINSRTYLNHLNPEYLRYYFAAKLGNGVEDIDLNLQDFQQRINADLIGKVVNIASRTASFITKKFDGQLAATLHAPALFEAACEKAGTIIDHYERREYSKAVREICAIADTANQYVDTHKPWVLNKDPAQADAVQLICTQALNLFKVIMTYLAPILPHTAERTAAFLNTPPLTFETINTPLLNTTIAPYPRLLSRIEDSSIEAMMAENKALLAAAQTDASA